MPFLWKTAPKKSTSVLQPCQGSVPAACLCRVGFTSPSFSAFNKLEIPLRSCCCSSQQAGKAAEARAASVPHPSLPLSAVCSCLSNASAGAVQAEATHPAISFFCCVYLQQMQECLYEQKLYEHIQTEWESKRGALI